MKWAIYLKTDAVLTNNPEKYLALRDHEPSEQDQPDNWAMRDRLTLYLWSWLGYLIMSLRVWRFSGRGGWREKLGNVEERVVEGGLSEKVQEIQDDE
jgi:hypothetical protein